MVLRGTLLTGQPNHIQNNSPILILLCANHSHSHSLSHTHTYLQSPLKLLWFTLFLSLLIFLSVSLHSTGWFWWLGKGCGHLGSGFLHVRAGWQTRQSWGPGPVTDTRPGLHQGKEALTWENMQIFHHRPLLTAVAVLWLPWCWSTTPFHSQTARFLLFPDHSLLLL